MIFPDPSHRVDLALIYNHVLSEIRTPITSQESRMLLVHTRDHHTYMVRGRLTMQSRSTCPSAQPQSSTALHMQDFGLWDQPCSLFGVWQVLRREGYGRIFVELDRQRPRRFISSTAVLHCPLEPRNRARNSRAFVSVQCPL
ncbi:hypothetical protein FOCG_13948 [Fusarium oxysporum f. sp. radicis-lycopersici 26381]|uniref:Uncharacterized protein n=1 Tax=Fusarium oxysporum Fo47 TaxID=660027 RepID=W9L404_FUSOX|nr:hypothetical protein FOZG_01560 [Fusarium oxysporum Fo47]EWZ91037.1 hypothetical protein FOWG_06772 [Fusarium oxysporum f. sp. lycopersici MN25]EXL43530.1 hypothetical protein FOCG_13948 [Fusarium oxysporum f. sp. radicis-lycopersici 26381]